MKKKKQSPTKLTAKEREEKKERLKLCRRLRKIDKYKEVYNRLGMTNHYWERIKERYNWDKDNVMIDFMDSIHNSKIFYSIKNENYRIIWYLWIYILSKDLCLITIIPVTHEDSNKFDIKMSNEEKNELIRRIYNLNNK